MKTIATEKHLLAVALCGLAGLASATAVTYENDFSKRTSGPVQTGQWLERRYATGRFAFNYTEPTPTKEAPYNNASDVQDNWAKVYLNGTVVSMIPSIADNSANEATGQNQYARFGRSDAIAASTGVMQSFFNSFSNGVLRLYADLCAPTNWPAGNGYVRIQPLYRESLATINWANGTKSVRCFTNWGIQRTVNGATSSNASKLIALVGDGKGSGQYLAGDNGSKHTNRHWYRFVMDLNLDAGTFTGTVYDQGTAHPKLIDANGTKVFDFPTLTANWKVNYAESGPIEGISLRASDFKTGTDRYLEPSFDNLVGEWKAPGATEFVRFYENDFETRRYRTIEPAGTTGHDYVRNAKSTWMSWYPYGEVTAATTTTLETQIAPNFNNSRTTYQPKGLNGWRRANTGNGVVGIVRYSNWNPALRISGTGNYVALTQTLGETITTGKVRFVYDFRTPDKWHWDNRGVYGILGDAGYWGAPNNGYSDHIGARMGVAGKSATAFQAHYNVASGSEIDTSSSSLFKSNTWYRAEIIADLDTKATVGRLYELPGQKYIDDTVSESALVYTKNSTMHSTVKEISSIGLAGYAAGVSQTTGVVHREHIYFDNLQVWKNWDETTKTGTRIFRDDFEACARTYPEQIRGTLIGSYHADDGQDHWIRRNNGGGDVWITSGANPCVAASGANVHSYAIQSLGSCFRSTKVVVQADMRPPCLWTWSLARAAQIIVGGDGFLNADIGNARDGKFTTKLYGQFGFGNAGDNYAYGFWNGTRFRAFDGDGKGDGTAKHSDKNIDASHWYRFKATFDLVAKTYDVQVYDQGTAHPASAATPTGTLVQTWTGLGLRIPPEENGITSICLNTYGNMPILPSDPEDAGLALYDNIVVKGSQGLSILVR